MSLVVFEIAKENYKIEQIKQRVALWLFIFVMIMTISDIRLYYFQSEIDKVNTEINRIELANVRQEIEILKQNIKSPVETTKIEIGDIEAKKRYLSERSKVLSWAKYIASLYVCILTGVAFFKPDSFFVNSIGFPGLIVVLICFLPTVV